VFYIKSSGQKCENFAKRQLQIWKVSSFGTNQERNLNFALQLMSSWMINGISSKNWGFGALVAQERLKKTAQVQ
jgi:hypothetical protein